MKPIMELAAELNGGRAGEFVPVAGTDRTVDAATFPNLRRLKLVRDEAHLSTTDGHNHLLSFGEFAAHHLLAWSTPVWRPLAELGDVYASAAASPVADLLSDGEACAPDEQGATPVAKW